MRNIIASLDLGSSYLKLVVGEIFKNKLNILTAVSVPSRGIKGGFVVNNESATESLKEVFDLGSKELGYPIKSVVVDLPSYNLSAFVSSSYVSVIGDVVTKDDVEKVINNCIDGNVPVASELISITPTYFLLDDVKKVRDPVGQSADKLFVRAVGNIIPKKNYSQIEIILKNIGVSIEDKIVNPIGDFFEFSSDDMFEHNGAIVNIGNIKSEVSIFNKGILVSSKTLNVGAVAIDQMIAYYYKLDKNDAIKLKEKLVTLDINKAKPSESLSFNLDGKFFKVNQYDVSEIAISKMLEMLNLIKKQINLLTKKEISYIIVTGGVTQLSDFEHLLYDVYGRSAKIGHVSEIGIRDNKYSSVAGTIKYYNKKLIMYNRGFSVINPDDMDDFSGFNKKINVANTSPLGKIFGMFYDN